MKLAASQPAGTIASGVSPRAWVDRVRQNQRVRKRYGRKSKSPDSPGGDVDSAGVHGVVNPHLLAALLCEQHDMDDEALGFVAVIHDLDPNLGGDNSATSHILAHCIKGMAVEEVSELLEVSANEVYLAKSRVMPMFEEEIQALSVSDK